MTPEPAATIQPARVIAIWNGVCERGWTLETTLVEFARQVLAEAKKLAAAKEHV